MKREILALSILALFIIPLFLTAVHAQTISNPFINSISNSSFFQNWQTGTLDMDAAKIMFFILIGIVILAVAGRIPIFQDGSGEAKWYVWPIALIGSYLGTAYLAPQEIFIMLSTWSALGVTLGIALPFVILAYFTFDLAQDTTASSPRMMRDEVMAYFIWILFAVFLAYRLFTAYSNPATKAYITGPGGAGWTMWLVWILMILTAMVIGFIPRIFGIVRDWASQEDVSKAMYVAENAARMQQINAESLQVLAGRVGGIEAGHGKAVEGIAKINKRLSGNLRDSKGRFA